MANEILNGSKWPKMKFNRKKMQKRFHRVEGATARHAHKFIIRRWSNVREVQTNVLMWVIIMAFLILSTGLQLMWFQDGYLTTASSKDGTYAEAVLGPINTLNPLFASTSAEQSASYLMFSSLLRYDTTGNLNNDLATSIVINDTKTVYTVSLRADAKWHDGIELTADDVAFTVGLMKNSNVRSVITGWDNVIVKVIDAHKIEFTLPAIYAAFEHALTFSILPKHILNDVSPSSIRENDFSQNPIGSGMFKFKFVQSSATDTDRKIVYMARNDLYYAGTANVSQFQLDTYSSTDEILQALSSNEVNAAADLSPIDVGSVNAKLYSVAVSPIKSGVYAIFNTKSVLLSDLGLRQALRLATNTAEIIDKLPAGTRALGLPFIDGQLIGAPDAPGFDLASAKKLLDDSGWVVGKNNIGVNCLFTVFGVDGGCLLLGFEFC